MHSEPIAVEMKSGRRLLVEVTVHGEEEVGVQVPKFDELSQTLAELAKSISAAIHSVKPDGFEVEFGVDAAIEAGKLTALLVKGTATANVKVTLRWGKA